MKITEIRLDRLRLPLDPPFPAAWDPEPRRRFDATVVRVSTDEGITGIGSGDTMDGFAAFEHLFLGKDPRRIAEHVRSIETINFHAGRYWPLEVALWDIIAQAAGLPVSHFFGNSTDRLPAYASSGMLLPPQERAQSVLAAKERGFRAMKIRISRDRLDEGVASVRAARDAVGDDFDLMVDLNQTWRMAGDTAPALALPKVRRLAEQLRDLGVLWLEEPLPQHDTAGFAHLRAETGIGVAGGEMVRGFNELLHLLDTDSLDVYQPDVVLAVGMHRARTFAEIAAARHRQFTPHTWSNGIGLLANLHVAAGVGAGPYLEFPYDPPFWGPERRDFMLTRPVDIDDAGTLAVPDEPGLGAALDDDALHRYRL